MAARGAAVDDLRRSPRSIVNLAIGFAAMVAAFAPQLIAWRVMYGAWWVVPQGPGFMRWDAPCWSEALFSSRNGLFPWSPAYAVLLVALVCAGRKLPRLVVALVGALALQAIANGAAWDWWAGGSFGGRRFDSCYVVFAVGAAFLIEWALQKKWRWSVVYVGCLVVANLWLAGRYTVTNARIYGADPASRVIPLKVPPPFGTIAGVDERAVEPAGTRGVRMEARRAAVRVRQARRRARARRDLPRAQRATTIRRLTTIPGGALGQRRDAAAVRRAQPARRRRRSRCRPGMTATWNGEAFTRAHRRPRARRQRARAARRAGNAGAAPRDHRAAVKR